ncbi:MAG: hypothetical protein H7308_11115 [Chthonomonadaceae bacterium]|nr:hypothetical protein [Chthonomonadaceae bacterium]
MKKIGSSQPTPEETIDLREEIQSLFAEMEAADISIKRDQDEIDRLKAETRAILAQLRAN